MNRLYMLALTLAFGYLGQITAHGNQTEKSPNRPSDEPCGQFLMRVVPPPATFDFKLTVRQPREDTEYKLRVINPCPESTERSSTPPEPGLRRESRRLKPPTSFKFQIEPRKNPDKHK